MRLVRLILIFAAATLWPAAAETPTWDTSGNSMLKGTYYFREVFYLVGYTDGSLGEGFALYGNITFDGNGGYTISSASAREFVYSYTNVSGGLTTAPNVTGTYSISASGYGFISNPLSSGDFIYGLVSQQGYFVGSSTESAFNDIFVAAPVSSATNATFKGSYTVAYSDLSGGGPLYTIGAVAQMNPDGAGNMSSSWNGYYPYGYGTSTITQTASSFKYSFSNGAASLAFPTSNSAALITGTEYLYISPDGNFVFGGSPQGFDMFVGVRTGTGTPNFGGLYYQAGVYEDETYLVSSGYGDLYTYYGSLNATGGATVEDQRLMDVFNANGLDGNFSDTYSANAGGAYTNSTMGYAVSADGTVRVGSGIWPYLGINVALAAPVLTSTATTPYLNPAGVVNAGSSAPFTAGIAPGELITLYGSNLASDVQVAPGIPFPIVLGNVQVMINGYAAPIYYVVPSVVSVIVPYAVDQSASYVARIQVINNGVASNAVTMFVNKTAPGVFTQTLNGLGYGAMLHPDYTLVTAQSPAKVGESVAVYLTGLGAVSPTISDGAAGPSVEPLARVSNTFTAYVGGVSATVDYAGLAPGLAGLYQFNVEVPSGVTAGDNTLYIGGPDFFTAQSTIPVTTATASAVSQSAEPAARIPRPATRMMRAVPCLNVPGSGRAACPDATARAPR